MQLVEPRREPQPKGRRLYQRCGSREFQSTYPLLVENRQKISEPQLTS